MGKISKYETKHSFVVYYDGDFVHEFHTYKQALKLTTDAFKYNEDMGGRYAIYFETYTEKIFLSMISNIINP